MSDLDGDLSDVNPALLALCQDPDVWREQRRRAMREKIYGQQAQNAAAGSSATHVENYMPPGGNGESSHGGSGTNAPANGVARSQSEREAYVLQQLLSRKRAREQEQQQQQPQPPSAPTQDATPSMRDKILQKYKK